MADDGNGRITVSRDALRADLAEMKNELKDYIADQLERKADARSMESLTQTVTLLADAVRKQTDGELTIAQRAVVQTIVDDTLDERSESGWTRKERRLALLGALTGILGAVASFGYLLAATGVIG